MDKTSFSVEEIIKLMHALTIKEVIFWADIVTMREHIKRIQGTELTIAEAAYVYLLRFHPEVKNLIFISDLEKNS